MTDILIRGPRKRGGPPPAEFAIAAADFKRVKVGDPGTEDDGKTYEELGFEVVGVHPTGEPYEFPAERKADEPAKAEKRA